MQVRMRDALLLSLSLSLSRSLARSLWLHSNVISNIRLINKLFIICIIVLRLSDSDALRRVISSIRRGYIWT